MLSSFFVLRKTRTSVELTKHHRSKPMAEYLRFSTNIAVEVALRFPEGKQVQSKLEGGADQMMYSLTDGRVMYVPLHVGERIRELRIGPGERFSLVKAEVKTGNRRGIEWQVKRVDPPPEPPAPRPAAPTAPQATKPEGAAAQPVTPAGVQSQSTNNGEGSAPAINGSGTVKANAAAPSKASFAAAAEEFMVTAIEAARKAEEYAASHNCSIRFTSEDIQGLASTLFIQAAREGWLTWRPGGTR
jgi:hypothetical protein